MKLKKMVSDAEKYKKEDEQQRDRIAAKNSLESYCFNMKTSINDDKIGAKISAEDKTKITETIEAALKWMESNQLAEKEEFDHKLKEVEKTCSPIMTKLYGGEGAASGGAHAPGGGSKSSGGKGPTIEEVD